MNWTGDIYRQTCGDYTILTQYSISGEFCTVKCGKAIIGYATDSEIAKQRAKDHRAQVSA